MLRTLRQRLTLTDIFIWLIGLAIAGFVIVGSIKTIQMQVYSPSVWLDLTIKGLALGGVYALIAMGYTMVYGILKMINFAHSEIFMSGPFTAVFVAIYLSKMGFYKTQPILSLALNLDCHPFRTNSLPTLAHCPPSGSTDHRHWSFLFSSVYIPRFVRLWLLWVSYGACLAEILDYWWDPDLRHPGGRDHGCCGNDGDPFWDCAVDQDRKSHAGCFRGQGSFRADGHRR
jgi:ABC-type branched-subunit amino acid transport system permease subunit